MAARQGSVRTAHRRRGSDHDGGGVAQMSLTWLASRASGEVALLLLRAVTVLGILTARYGSGTVWRRYTLSQVHRYLSVVAVVFLGLHILVTVLDSYVTVPWWSAVLPFTSPYLTFAVGLGAVSVLLLLAVILTSLIRVSLGYPVWKRLHYLAYGAWAIGSLHAVLAGTDQLLTFSLAAGGLVAVAASLLLVQYPKGRSAHAHNGAATTAADIH